MGSAAPAAVLVLVLGSQSLAQAPPFETRKITDTVYVFRYGGHQAMFGRLTRRDPRARA